MFSVEGAEDSEMMEGRAEMDPSADGRSVDAEVCMQR